MDAKERRAFEDLGQRVRELRVARGWTQEQAAERLGLDARELQRLEGGKVNVTLRKLLRVARGLGETASALLEPPTNREPRKPGRPKRS